MSCLGHKYKVNLQYTEGISLFSLTHSHTVYINESKTYDFELLVLISLVTACLLSLALDVWTFFFSIIIHLFRTIQSQHSCDFEYSFQSCHSLIHLWVLRHTDSIHIQKFNRVEAEVRDSKHSVQSFHSCLGGGITLCDVTVTDYCRCALCFKAT